jgi:hypothetical protein
LAWYVAAVGLLEVRATEFESGCREDAGGGWVERRGVVGEERFLLCLQAKEGGVAIQFEQSCTGISQYASTE